MLLLIYTLSIADGSDYSLAMGSYTQVTLTPANQAVQHTINIINDEVVLEEKETLSLELQWLSGQHVDDLHNTTVAIVDTDGMLYTESLCVECRHSSAGCSLL